MVMFMSFVISPAPIIHVHTTQRTKMKGRVGRPVLPNNGKLIFNVLKIYIVQFQKISIPRPPPPPPRMVNGNSEGEGGG